MRLVITTINVLALMLTASSFLNIFVGDLGDAALPGTAGPDRTMRLFADISETGMKVGLVLAVVIAGTMYALGFGSSRSIPDKKSSSNRNARPIQRALSLSPEVVAVRKRISTSIITLRGIPSDTVSAETKIDLAAIRERHLPDLEKAHRTARQIYPESGPEAETLDKDLTASLEQIATRLDEMIEECGREARSDFAIQRRFIELRHPATAEDPLALPQVRMVDAGA